MSAKSFFTNIGQQAKSYWTGGGGKANVLNILEDLTYRIYFVSKKSGMFYIPINPQTIKCSMESDTYTANIIGIGEIVQPKIPKLRIWSWEGMLMLNINDPLNLKGVTLPPGSYIKMWEQMQSNKEVFDFVYTSMNNALQYIKQTNTKAIIKSLDWEERGGEPGDIYYNITVQEYREFEPKITLVDNEDAVKKLNEGFDNIAKNEQIQRATNPNETPIGTAVKVSGRAKTGPNGELSSAVRDYVSGSITDIKDGKDGLKYYRVLYSDDPYGKKAGWYTLQQLGISKG